MLEAEPDTYTHADTTVGNSTQSDGRNLYEEVDSLKDDVAVVLEFFHSPHGKQLMVDMTSLANVHRDIALLKQATGLHGLEESALSLAHVVAPTL